MKNMCDGCNRNLPKNEKNMHVGNGFDIQACTKHLYFDSFDEAIEWMRDIVDDQCISNIRYSYADDDIGMEKFMEIESAGCCGSIDYGIVVNGRVAIIGCNYGH
jgi:hypothetical protein